MKDDIAMTRDSKEGNIPIGHQRTSNGNECSNEDGDVPNDCHACQPLKDNGACKRTHAECNKGHGTHCALVAGCASFVLVRSFEVSNWHSDN